MSKANIALPKNDKNNVTHDIINLKNIKKMRQELLEIEVQKLQKNIDLLKEQAKQVELKISTKRRERELYISDFYANIQKKSGSYADIRDLELSLNRFDEDIDKLNQQQNQITDNINQLLEQQQQARLKIKGLQRKIEKFDYLLK